jgi:non-canonical poly(A) RNA polymerase PAPD5/7
LAFYEVLMSDISADTRDKTPIRNTEKRVKHESPESDRMVDRRDRKPKQSIEKRAKAQKDQHITRSPWDIPAGNGESAQLDWKTRMQALSQYVRENRVLLEQGPAEGQEGPNSLHYEGLVIAPNKSNVDTPIPTPWATTSETLQKTPRHTAAQVLDLEIDKFAKYMSPTVYEEAARYHVKQNIRHCIMSDPKNTIPHIYHFGSTKTGVAMPYSDIDIGVYNQVNRRDTLEEFMVHLASLLDRGTDYMCVVYRPPPNAIITAQHVETGLTVQIIAKGPPGKQDRAMKRFLEQIPHIYETYAVVRTAFGVRGFVDPFIGGISAYGTFMMIAAALAYRGTPSHIHESRSAQLLHVLSFWSDFDTEKYGITFDLDNTAKPFVKMPPDSTPAEEAERLQKIETARRNGDEIGAAQYRIGRIRPRQPYLLCLQDPASPINDIGVRCHAIKHIKETIKAMYADLLRAMAKHDQTVFTDKMLKSEIPPLLEPLVGRSHELFAERRNRMVAKKTGLKLYLKSPRYKEWAARNDEAASSEPTSQPRKTKTKKKTPAAGNKAASEPAKPDRSTTSPTSQPQPKKEKGPPGRDYKAERATLLAASQGREGDIPPLVVRKKSWSFDVHRK